ncbi:hypothetical protein M9H77_03003 [Catharanthus roseus]|uniref:Uncharacterized protein n=1 Tax=Catharanthus roseus TaxID=4058 RepID=A0ACC0CA66_CATRO|nr:hypothetical protein M9H77_03003 [Catharanthus roseus]
MKTTKTEPSATTKPDLSHEVGQPTVSSRSKDHKPRQNLIDDEELKNQIKDFDLQLGDSKDELGRRFRLRLRLQFQSEKRDFPLRVSKKGGFRLRIGTARFE